MSVLWSDLRFAVRGLMKARGFSIAAITALALGIGPNTAIFSVVYATLLAPLPFPEPHQLVMVWSKTPTGDRSAVSPGDYLAWKETGEVVPVSGADLAAALQPVDHRRAAPRAGASRHTRRASDAWRGRCARTGLPARRRSAREEPGRAAQQSTLAHGLRRRSRPSSAATSVWMDGPTPSSACCRRGPPIVCLRTSGCRSRSSRPR